MREERDAVKLRAAEAADRAEGHAEQMRGKLARLESGRAALADVLRDVAAMVPEIELERPGSRASLWTHDDPVAGAALGDTVAGAALNDTVAGVALSDPVAAARRALQALQVMDAVLLRCHAHVLACGCAVWRSRPVGLRLSGAGSRVQRQGCAVAEVSLQ